MIKEQKVINRLKELGFDVEQFGYTEVARQTYDDSCDMGYLYLKQESTEKITFGGNMEFPKHPAPTEFVLDLGHEYGQVIGIEIYHPANYGYIAPGTKTYGFNLS